MERLMRQLVMIAVGVVASVALAAQSPSPLLPQFDVASVKPNVSNQGPRGINFSPSGRFAWNRMTLKQLVSAAYGDLGHKAIVGGPPWLDTAAFDIAATSPDALRELDPDGSPRGLFLRLRALLEDRFQLRTHVERRELPVFALVPATIPMAAGPSLRPVDVDCEQITRAMASGQRPMVPEGQLPPCSRRVSLSSITGRALTTSALADALQAPAGRPVIDLTGLTGYFDVDVEWTPELPAGALLNGAPVPPSAGPSIFTAVREQLGLRLVARRAAVPVLVVDSAHLPDPD